MLTAGVDLSSQPRGTASCLIEWSAGRPRVSDVTVGVTDKAIVGLLGSVDKLGIDVPLGWPVAFVDAVVEHSRRGTWPVGYRHADTSSYRYRETDRWVWKTLGKPAPLSVSTDPIALPAMRAAALLSKLPDAVALDGSGVAVEAYPAAALLRWGLPSRRYKGREHAPARGPLVEVFAARTASWLDLDEAWRAHCGASDDAFDALVAALVASGGGGTGGAGGQGAARGAAARDGSPCPSPTRWSSWRQPVSEQDPSRTRPADRPGQRQSGGLGAAMSWTTDRRRMTPPTTIRPTRAERTRKWPLMPTRNSTVAR